jgi:hypothetical protein
MRIKRDEWAKRIERWKDSGLTAAEYGAETGLNRHTLTYWKWRLKAQPGVGRTKSAEKQTAPMPAGFVEVKMPLPEPIVVSEPAEPLELLLAGGMRLRIPVRFDEQALRRVVAVLGGQ